VKKILIVAALSIALSGAASACSKSFKDIDFPCEYASEMIIIKESDTQLDRNFHAITVENKLTANQRKDNFP
jgi:hypothetical protein